MTDNDGRPVADFSLRNGVYQTGQCSAPGWAMRVDPAKAVKPENVRPVKEWIGR